MAELAATLPSLLSPLKKQKDQIDDTDLDSKQSFDGLIAEISQCLQDAEHKDTLSMS